MSSERLLLCNKSCLVAVAGYRSCVHLGLLMPDGEPDQQVGHQQVDEGQDAGGDQPRPVQVVEDVSWVLSQLRDVVVHHLRPGQQMQLFSFYQFSHLFP